MVDFPNADLPAASEPQTVDEPAAVLFLRHSVLRRDGESSWKGKPGRLYVHDINGSDPGGKGQRISTFIRETRPPAAWYTNHVQRKARVIVLRPARS